MNERIHNIVIVTVFFGVLVALTTAMAVAPNRASSKLEERMLARAPQLTEKSLENGDYAKSVEKYVSDQFAGRDVWVRGYSGLNVRVLKKTSSHGVVVGTDGQLLQDQSQVKYLTDSQIDAEVATSVAQFKTLDNLVSSYGGTFLFVGHPSKSSFMRANYPAGFEFPSTIVRSEPKLFAALDAAGVETLNMRPIFEAHRSEGLYYKTDHHWTMRSAYLVYAGIVDTFGMKPLTWKGDFRITTLSNPFHGSLNRKLALAFPTNEHLSIATLRKPIPYTKKVVRLGATRAETDNSLYRMPKKSSDPVLYSMYMYGDLPEVVIKTNRPELPNVLLFADSFSNSVEPLLWTSFNETRILDLRHYTKMSLYDYIKQYKPDYVVTMVRDEFYFRRTGNGWFSGPKSSADVAE